MPRAASWAPGPLLAVLGLLLSGPLAGGSVAFAGPEAIGAERCGACHVSAYEDWKASPHARALARLTPAQQKNKVCRSCHTMNPASDDPRLAGVQCESCHGPGSLYAPDYVMRDPKLRVLFGLDKISEATCARCHNGATPNVRAFDYSTWVKRVDHKSEAKTPKKPETGARAVPKKGAEAS